ncbi:MAG: nucleoside triphosphate pyrophosphohydrolase family protein [Cuniculiplasma sp.]
MEGIGMENCTYGKLMNWSMGLAGESGEVVDILKKILFHGHPIEKEKLLKELGDILWYLDAIASSLGSSLNEIAELNVEKLKKRYPDGFSEEKSINRKE